MLRPVLGERGSLRRRLLAGAYVVLATALVLGTVEWLARRRNRFGYVRSPSPEIVYELRPGYPDHNSSGYRDHEYARAKKPGVFRVIGLGDSYAYGSGVARDQVFLKVAERLLEAELGPGRVEVLNFGLPGANTAMEAAMLAERLVAGRRALRRRVRGLPGPVGLARERRQPSQRRGPRGHRRSARGGDPRARSLSGARGTALRGAFDLAPRCGTTRARPQEGRVRWTSSTPTR